MMRCESLILFFIFLLQLWGVGRGGVWGGGGGGGGEPLLWWGLWVCDHLASVQVVTFRLWVMILVKVGCWKKCRWMDSLLVSCLISQQYASLSQELICSDNCTCCHTEMEVADQTFYLTQSQYTATRTTSPSTDPIALGTWQGIHWSATFYVTGMTWPGKIPMAQVGIKLFRSRGGRWMAW